MLSDPTVRKVPFFLVTGFLGSGKTTLIKNILKQFSSTRKIAIVQNEFAPSSVDGTDLKTTGFPHALLEINNGSVFCVCLLGNFVDSLARFVKEAEPDAVFLEASGLSDPIAIAELFQFAPLSELLYLSHIWCVVDTCNFRHKTPAEIRISRQVRIADTVILNKTDLGPENLEAARQLVMQWNPHASMVSSSFCQLPFEDLFSPFQRLPLALRKQQENRSLESSGRPDHIKTAVLKSGRVITPENLALFLRQVAPGTYRIKGFVRQTTGRTAAVQSSFGRIEITEVPDDTGNTVIIFIGPDCDSSRLSKQYKMLASG